jgi:transposase
MSLHPHAPYPIPEETQRVARAAFPRGNLSMQVADHLGPLYHDAQFTALFPRRGQPAEAPARLALVTLLQFAEGLSDRQAADAVRSRIDFPIGGFSPPEGRLARGFKPPAFSRFLFQSAVKSAESF